MIDWLVGLLSSIDYTIVLFLILFGWFLWHHRKNLEIQKIAGIFLYVALLKTKVGLPLMDFIATKFRKVVRFFGYISIVIGVLAGLLTIYLIFLQIATIIIEPSTPSGAALILPGMSVPGFGVLSFWYWIICLFLVIVVHEFSHGVVSRAHNIPVKSSGIGAFGIVIPLLPLAFVEPDDKKLLKAKDSVQQSMYAAGPVSNIFFAIISMFIISLVINPWVFGMHDFDKVSVTPTIGNDSYPAALAGIENNSIITMYNGERVYNRTDFIKHINKTKPGETIAIGNENITYQLTTISHPLDSDVAFLGVGFDTVLKPGKTDDQYNFALWFKGLFMWLYLINIAIGTINLYPLGITDGGEMLTNMLNRFLSKKKAQIWNKRITSFFVVVLLFLVFKGLLETFGIM